VRPFTECLFLPARSDPYQQERERAAILKKFPGGDGDTLARKKAGEAMDDLDLVCFQVRSRPKTTVDQIWAGPHIGQIVSED
jgi:hypothetical protein